MYEQGVLTEDVCASGSNCVSETGLTLSVYVSAGIEVCVWQRLDTEYISRSTTIIIICQSGSLATR
jgi:hypothetical protein